MTPLEKAARAYAAAEGYPDDFNDDADGEYRAWCFEVTRAVLMAVREQAWDLHLTGEAAIADGREADGVFIAMIDAILAEPQP